MLTFAVKRSSAVEYTTMPVVISNYQIHAIKMILTRCAIHDDSLTFNVASVLSGCCDAVEPLLLAPDVDQSLGETTTADSVYMRLCVRACVSMCAFV